MSDESNQPAAPAETNEIDVSDNSTSEDSNESSESSSSSPVSAETESELEQEIQEAIEDGASAEQVKNMIRNFTLKVNGKEYQRSIDLSDDETLKKELQLAMAGRHAMQENAELKKVYNGELKRLKDDPFGFLSELGYDPVELAAKRLDEYVRENDKTPEQRETEARQKRYRELEEENARLKNERESEKKKAIMDKAEAELEHEIKDALEKYGQLEETPELIYEISDAIFTAMDSGWHDVRAEDIIPTVHERMLNKFRRSLGSLKSKDALKSLLGDDVLKSLRDERIEQAKKVASVKNLKTDVSKIPDEIKKEPQKIKLSDLLNGRSKI